jgi:hypothetical protein
MDTNQPNPELESQQTAPPSETPAIPMGLAMTPPPSTNESNSADDPVLELAFNEPDSPSNIEYDPTDPTKIKTCSFAKLIEKLTSPKKDGLSFFRFKLFRHFITIFEFQRF